ncbi:MAG: GNAT family N-acetyltransferase [Deltaproteobacteria bacterium]|nr:GNAT family N-acetyltransferase [Deltaproteobacteria bacterium]MBW2137261.1 GNAT family N-acetyltransferase [Deltaproteobacteria bacterium]
MGQDDSNFSSNIEDLDNLCALWEEDRQSLEWTPLFVVPPWLRAWWDVFGSPRSSYLYTVRNQKGELVGLAPLVVRGNRAFFMGSEDVCDYMDFLVAAGSEERFFDLFWQDIKSEGIRSLTLGAVRHDSRVATHLVKSARERGLDVSRKKIDVSLEIDLPGSWEAYLGLLTGKQRHELRRKLRRVQESAEARFRVIEDIEEHRNALELFFQLFRKSRKDKDEFMRPDRESFFRALAANMSRAGLLRIDLLELAGKPVATFLAFDYEEVVYLYNSGFDPQYGNLGVGLVSKILCIKDSIEKGKRKFDFLKGPELYKYRLGGKEVPLESCRINLG